jgi:precorrin-6B methylase 2
MTYASLGTATLENGNACWHIGDLTGSLTLSLKAKVDVGAPAGSLTNTAKATSSNAGNAKASATVDVPAKHGVKGKLKRTAAGVTG